MRNTDIKFTVSLTLVTLGMILLCFDVRWLFFVGFTMVMFSGLFETGYQPYLLGFMGILLMFRSSLGSCSVLDLRKPPMIYLVLVWVLIAAQAFYRWRKLRTPGDTLRGPEMELE